MDYTVIISKFRSSSNIKIENYLFPPNRTVMAF